MNEFECVFTVVGSTLPATVEECQQELAEAGMEGRIDGNGYITVPCDGKSPEVAAAFGCRPCTTMERAW